MILRPLGIPIMAGVIGMCLTLPIPRAWAQEGCEADSVGAAQADSLLPTMAGLLGYGPASRNAIFTDVRRAVQTAPLSHERWAKMLAWARFLSAADSAITWATLALQHWPRCARSDTALAQAQALAARMRRP